MTVFNTGFPSVRQIQVYIKDKTPVQIVLSNSEELQGVIQWQDQNCVCLLNSQQEKILIWIQSIIYVKGK